MQNHENELPKRTCCSNVEQIFWNQGGRQMLNAHTQGGWTVSEVERLTGLSRRDIQRCCYQGKGGVGILEPQDSAWERRTYSACDLAMLFVVRLEKQAGLSLPEIAEKLHDQPVSECGSRAGALPTYIARLAERQEEIAGQLLATRALFLATSNKGTNSLAQLVEREVDVQLTAAFLPPANIAGGQTVKCADPHEKTGVEYKRPIECGWFARSLVQLEGQAAHSPKAAREHAVNALAHAIDCIHEHYGVSHITAKQALSWALDAPGMPLAIELWLGPATHKVLVQALR